MKKVRIGDIIMWKWRGEYTLGKVYKVTENRQVWYKIYEVSKGGVFCVGECYFVLENLMFEKDYSITLANFARSRLWKTLNED